MLKRVFFLICALIVVAMAIGANKAHANPVCEALRFYAYEVMKGRQLGLPKHVAINETYNGYGGDSPHPIMLVVVDKAYETPIYQDDAVKQLAVQAFSENWHYDCINR